MSTQKIDPTSSHAQNLLWTRTDLLNIGAIGLAILFALGQFWQPGIPNPNDMLMSVHRVFELVNAWHYGIFYPRLGPDLNFGYGAPLFQFYPPLASYIALFFHGAGLGLIDATKATASVGLLLAALGMYCYARLLFLNRCAALSSAIIYGLAPYLLLNLYERGAVAEGLALMVLPWLFWSLRVLLFEGHARNFCVAAGLVAAMMLAHNITALWAIPTAGLYFVALALYERRWQGGRRVLFAFGLGLGLSAFYWLPALAEVKFTHATIYMLQKPAEFATNLVTWSGLLQPTLLFQYAGPLRFRFSLLQALLGASGLLVLPWCKGRLRVELIGLAVAWFVTLFLQLQFTLNLWQNVPLMRFVQFPWRLFGLAAFCTALLGGTLFTGTRLGARWVWPLALGTGLLFMGANVSNLTPKQLPLWLSITEAEINQLDLLTRGAQGYPLFSDYSPESMQLDSKDFTLSRLVSFPPFPPLAAQPVMQVVRENPVFAELAVAAPTPFTLRFSRVFFPGWQVYQADQPVPTYGSGAFGLVTADLPAGNYSVRIQFDQSPLRRMADGLSLVALVIGLVSGLVGWRRRWWPVGLLVAGLTGGLFFYQQTRTLPGHQPTPYAVNFQDIVHLVGFDLPKTTWRSTETITLRLYWLAQQTPSVNYKIFLHLARLDDSGQVAQVDSQPLLGFIPMTNWEAGGLVVDQQQFKAETPIPPGRYRLLMGVYQTEPLQNLLVRSAPVVLPGDRVVLTEVDIIDE